MANLSPKIVVLDDDPTGTQAVHNVPVLTEWSIPSLVAELTAPGTCCYILTNSRASPTAQACGINREIGRNLIDAARSCGRSFQVISRSDSTLRGHYPAETDALDEALGGTFDATLIIPAFFEGGRITRDDIHYVAHEGGLVPAGETEFARDATFGYRSSNLRDWVEEKTAGGIRADKVVSVSLADLRGERARLVEKLAALSRPAVAIVNAEQPSDLAALAAALQVVALAGKKFLFRTAASFVAALAGITARALLRADEIAKPGTGRGLVVAGSHVGKTTAQLQLLLENPRMSPVKVEVERLLAPATHAAEIALATQQVETLLEECASVVLFTSRRLITGRDAEQNLAIGKTVSRSLVEIVSGLRTRPRWLIAKGGITSSDVATAALGVRRALVLGQALPGVPVWQLGPEARWPGLAYVVFPGNVGAPAALAQLAMTLG